MHVKVARAIVNSRRHLFTVAEYMSIDVPERTELFGGVVYDVSPGNPPHANAVRWLVGELSRGLDRATHQVSVQDPIAISGWRGRDAPQIDIAVIQFKRYTQMPTVADAFAFIEVSDSSYLDDRNYKIPLYLNAGVQSWIVNLAQRQVEAYRSIEDLALPHGVVISEGSSFEVCGVSIAVSDLFDAEVPE